MPHRPSIPSLARVPEHALVARLEQLGADPHRAGDAIRGRGICHGGRRSNTLMFSPTADGRSWRVHCWAGCDWEAIVGAILGRGRLPKTSGPVADWTTRAGAARAAHSGRPPFFDDGQVKAVIREHDALLAEPELIDRLRIERCITIETIRSEWLGWRASEQRIVIPYLSPLPDEQRRPFQRDRWLPSWARTGTDREVKVLAEPGRPRWLYVPRPDLLAARHAVLCEGAMDALAAVSVDVAAVAAPSGGSAWKSGWTAEPIELEISKVYLPHDLDATGQRFSREVQRVLPAAGIKVVPVDLREALARWART